MQFQLFLLFYGCFWRVFLLINEKFGSVLGFFLNWFISGNYFVILAIFHSFPGFSVLLAIFSVHILSIRNFDWKLFLCTRSNFSVWSNFDDYFDYNWIELNWIWENFNISFRIERKMLPSHVKKASVCLSIFLSLHKLWFPICCNLFLFAGKLYFKACIFQDNFPFFLLNLECFLNIFLFLCILSPRQRLECFNIFVWVFPSQQCVCICFDVFFFVSKMTEIFYYFLA